MNLLEIKNTKPLLYFLIFAMVVGFIFYWRVGVEENPGDYRVKKGNYRLEDGQFDQAIKEFEAALAQNDSHVFAHLGLAIAYLQLGDDDKSIQEFNRTIELDPNLAVAYADRGILFDRAGKYQEALHDYKRALALNAEVLEGPGWLWRFLRNVDEKPPAIADRAKYLEAELQKPPEKRLLKMPDEDIKQQMYKVNG